MGDGAFEMTGADPTQLMLALVAPMTFGVSRMAATIIVDGIMPNVEGANLLVEAGGNAFPDLVHPAVSATGS